MTANAQDVIMLVGDSLTQHGWKQGGFAQLLAGAQITNIWWIYAGCEITSIQRDTFGSSM
jgi:hypothetical protein